MKINKRLLTRLKKTHASTTPMKINKKLLTRLKKNTRVDNTYESKQEVVDTSQNIASKTPTKI